MTKTAANATKSGYGNKTKITNIGLSEKSMIIDAHAHIYPDKIAEKATAAIGEFYDIKMELPFGTAEQLIEDGKNAGVTKYIVHSVATKPAQVKAINDFIIAETTAHKEFVGFMTLHEDLSEDEIAREIDRCISAGLKGIKLHPDFQKFYIDGENARKIYRAAGDRLPILFHTGDDRFEFSKPARLAAVAKEFKKTRFIGAHFGGYRCWDDVDVYKGLDNVFFDTSSSLPFIAKERAERLISEFGAERFFFGTDFPMWDASEELARFMRLSLTDGEREKILYKNVTEFLGL